MKFKRLFAAVLILCFVVQANAAYADNNDMCRIKWLSRGALFKANHMTDGVYCMAYSEAERGSVVTVEELPDMEISYNTLVRNCYCAWDAPGREIQGDTTFELKWHSQISGEYAVIWNAYIPAIDDEGYYSAVVASYPEGHVISEEDLPKLRYDGYDLPVEFTWEGAVGTVIDDDMHFDIVCRAKAEGEAALCRYIPQNSVYPLSGYDLCVDFSPNQNNPSALIEIYSKGSRLSGFDMQNLYDEYASPGTFIDYDIGWDTDTEGMMLDDDLSVCLQVFQTLYTDVTFMQDDDTVFRKYDHVKRSKAFIFPTAEEYAEAAKLTDDKVLAVWRQTDTSTGHFPWEVSPGYEHILPRKSMTYVPVIYTIGDADLDGTVNTRDAYTVLRACAVSGDYLKYRTVADMNRDGTVNTADAVCILKKVAGVS